jgi:hypothetical protein
MRLLDIVGTSKNSYSMRINLATYLRHTMLRPRELKPEPEWSQVEHISESTSASVHFLRLEANDDQEDYENRD